MSKIEGCISIHYPTSSEEGQLIESIFQLSTPQRTDERIWKILLFANKASNGFGHLSTNEYLTIQRLASETLGPEFHLIDVDHLDVCHEPTMDFHTINVCAISSTDSLDTLAKREDIIVNLTFPRE